jgi:hypothetical protein
MAETTQSGALGEREVFALKTLAELGPPARERMLFSHEEFQAFDSPVAPDQRRRLRALLDLFGIARSLELIDGGVQGARRLEKELESVSGIERLRRLLDESFARRADALKANAALRALSRISWQAADAATVGALHELRDAVEGLRLEPDLRIIGEIWAAQAAAAPETLLPEHLQEDVVRLTASDAPAAKLGLPPGASREHVHEAARQAVTRWRTYANVEAVTELESRLARTLYRSFEALAAEAGGDSRADHGAIR